MIEKILDKYYIKKLKREIKNTLLNWNLAYKFIETDYAIDLWIKRTYYNDKEYELIVSLEKIRALKHLINYEKLENFIIECVNEYVKRSKEKE